MDTATAEPFADVTLEYLAEVITGYYTGSAITLFFQRAGFSQYAHDGSTKKWFVYKALQEIQVGEDGSSKIKKIIEHFCNPKERVSEEYVESVCKILND